MSVEQARVRDVRAYYGVRQTDEGRTSTQWVGGNAWTKEVAFHSDDFGNVAGTIPAGSVIRQVLVEVVEAFALGGTTPTFLIGTDGSEVTNGLVISEAQAEAVATYDVTATLTGTWDALLAAETTIGVALGGGSPTVTAVGHIVLKISYDLAG